MKIAITISKKELKDALKSPENFEEFLDICKCKYEMELARTLMKAITSKEEANND